MDYIAHQKERVRCKVAPWCNGAPMVQWYTMVQWCTNGAVVHHVVFMYYIKKHCLVVFSFCCAVVFFFLLFQCAYLCACAALRTSAPWCTTAPLPMNMQPTPSLYHQPSVWFQAPKNPTNNLSLKNNIK